MRVDINYTGHPLVDVGLAAITAYNGKRSPHELTAPDLESAGKFIERVYFDPRWRGLMFTIFPNSAFTQPKIGPEKKAAYLNTYLYGFKRAGALENRCSFCSQPALARGYRQQVPLTTGEGMVNFSAEGNPGLPVCGTCFLAIQAFLLGSVRCSGRALFVHSDDPKITFTFARRFLTENRRLLTLTDGDAFDSAQNLKYPKTYFVAQLLDVEKERALAHDETKPCSITVYYLTNYGTNADISVFHFPLQVMEFLRRAHRAPHGAIWERIEARAWQIAVNKKTGKKQDGAVEMPVLGQPINEPGRARNYLFEDIFQLPNNAARFVRTYLLRGAYRSAFAEDPRRTYSLTGEMNLVSWPITEILLREIMNMDGNRIGAIRRLADRLAERIASGNDRQLFRGLSLTTRYSELRRALVLADTREVKAGHEPLVTFDDFVEVFEFGENSFRPDWGLARDLVLIRVVEKLHNSPFFKANPDVIIDEEFTKTQETNAENVRESLERRPE